MSDEPFVDHYAVLGCNADTPAAELKQAYFDKLREFHPDKRPESPGGVGQRVTLALTEAWAVLKDPAKREVYDYVWRREREAGAGAPAQETPDDCRRSGNELYKEAQIITKQAGSDIAGAAKALQKYQAAIAKYSRGIELAPCDYRFYSNRALCYFALGSWSKAREDAERTTQLKADFMKGWFMLVRTLCREGSFVAAVEKLDAAQRILPNNPELQALRGELETGGDCGRWGGGDRSVSPACTPQRFATPPQLRRPAPPGGPSPYSRSVHSRSPSLGGGGSRLASTSPATRGAEVTVGTQGTAHFGDNTGDFGASTRGTSIPKRVDRWTSKQATPPRGRPGDDAGRPSPPGGRPGAEFQDASAAAKKPPTPPRQGSFARTTSFWDRAIGQEARRETLVRERVASDAA